MGNEQSLQRRASLSSRTVHREAVQKQTSLAYEGKIVVVSRGEPSSNVRQEEEELAEQIKQLNFRPLIPLGFETIPSNFEQINHIPLLNISLIVQRLLRSKAEMVMRNQTKISEMIKEAEIASAFLSSQFAERDKKVIKSVEIFDKINSIEQSLIICEKKAKDCAEKLNKLNALLPDSSRLETLNYD